MSRPMEEIREAFQRVHRVATGQSREAYMRIPADPKHDADLIVCAAIDELEQTRLALAASREREEKLTRALEFIEATLCDRPLCGHFTAEEIRDIALTALWPQVTNCVPECRSLEFHSGPCPTLALVQPAPGEKP